MPESSASPAPQHSSGRNRKLRPLSSARVCKLCCQRAASWPGAAGDVAERPGGHEAGHGAEAEGLPLPPDTQGPRPHAPWAVTAVPAPPASSSSVPIPNIPPPQLQDQQQSQFSKGSFQVVASGREKRQWHDPKGCEIKRVLPGMERGPQRKETFV